MFGILLKMPPKAYQQARWLRRLQLVFGLVTMVSAGSVLAASPGQTTPQGQKPLIIKANEMLINHAEKQAVYRGQVETRQGDLTMHSERLVISYTSEEIQKAHAYGQPVRIERGTQHGRAHEAIFDQASRSLLLIGEARLVEGDNLLEGHRIRYLLDQRRVEVHGAPGSGPRARAVFQSGQLPRSPKGADSAVSQDIDEQSTSRKPQ